MCACKMSVFVINKAFFADRNETDFDIKIITPDSKVWLSFCLRQPSDV